MRIKNIFIALFVLFTTSATAQNEMGDMPKAPIDAAVKIGHLDNGLTYYIRKNNYPEGKVNFYIAHKVGRSCTLVGTHGFQWVKALPRRFRGQVHG